LLEVYVETLANSKDPNFREKVDKARLQLGALE